MLTLNDAIKACKRADNVQYDLYVELCNLRGEHPGGRNHQDDVNSRSFKIEDYESHLRKRLAQIRRIKQDIADLQEVIANSDSAKAISSMIEELNAIEDDRANSCP